MFNTRNSREPNATPAPKKGVEVQNKARDGGSSHVWPEDSTFATF